MRRTLPALALAALFLPAAASAAIVNPKASVKNANGTATILFIVTDRITLSMEATSDGAGTGNITFAFSIKDRDGVTVFSQTGNAAPATASGITGATLSGIPLSRFYTKSGNYTLTGTATLGTTPITDTVVFQVRDAKIDLLLPANNATDVNASPIKFQWGVAASRYRLTVAEDVNFAKIKVKEETSGTSFDYRQDLTTLTQNRLAGGTAYYWKVEGLDSSGNVIARPDIPFQFTLKAGSDPGSRDLAITGIAPRTLRAGEKFILVDVTVENRGGQSEGNIEVALSNAGQALQSEGPSSVGTLPQGSKANVTFRLPLLSRATSARLLAFLTGNHDDAPLNDTFSKDVSMPGLPLTGANACAASPCMNRGVCTVDTQSPNGYVCNCLNGYAGTVCERLTSSEGKMPELSQGLSIYKITTLPVQESWVLNPDAAGAYVSVDVKVANMTGSAVGPVTVSFERTGGNPKLADQTIDSLLSGTGNIQKLTFNIPFAAPNQGGTLGFTVTAKADGLAAATQAKDIDLNARRTALNYSWNAGAFGACDGTACSTGLQSRTIQCRRGDDGSVVADDFCAATKPSPVQACSTACSQVAAAKPTNTWFTGAYTQCPQTLPMPAGAKRSRSVYCTNANSAVLLDSDCLSSGNKPASSESCVEGNVSITALNVRAPQNNKAGVEISVGSKASKIVDAKLVVKVGGVVKDQVDYHFDEKKADATFSAMYDQLDTDASVEAELTSVKFVDGSVNAGKVKMSGSLPAKPAAPLYSWKSVPYGACQPASAGCSQNVNVYCILTSDPNLEARDPSNCTTPKPATTQSCACESDFTITRDGNTITVMPKKAPASGVSVSFAASAGMLSSNTCYFAAGSTAGCKVTYVPAASALASNSQTNVSISLAASGVDASNFRTGDPFTFTFTPAVNAAAAKLGFTTAPSATAAPRKTFAVQPVVSVLDAQGTVVTTAGNTVTLSANSGCGLGPAASLSKAAVGGIAAFSGLYIDASGDSTACTITASAAGLTSAGAPVTVARTFSYLAFSKAPNNEVSGEAFSVQPVVQAYGVDGLPFTGKTGTVVLSAGKTGLTLSPAASLTATMTGGVATFTGVIGTVSAAGDYSLTATEDGASCSSPVSITVRAAAVCGNGIVEGGEQCDGASPCCTAACRFAQVSKPCGSAAGACWKKARCDAKGQCRAAAKKPDGTACKVSSSGARGSCSSGTCASSSTTSSARSVSSSDRASLLGDLKDDLCEELGEDSEGCENLELTGVEPE